MPSTEVPNPFEHPASRSEDSEEAKALELKLRDLEITNRAKDYFIEQLQKERDSFNGERQGYVEKLMSFSQRVGELQTKLLRLDPPGNAAENVGEISEPGGTVPQNLENIPL